ncbi:MAG: hypothetical protein CMD23_01065 [Flavobacteriales bacterium]|nr:hypothetical protein [Flavobacteriales bacterium]
MLKNLLSFENKKTITEAIVFYIVVSSVSMVAIFLLDAILNLGSITYHIAGFLSKILSVFISVSLVFKILKQRKLNWIGKSLLAVALILSFTKSGLIGSMLFISIVTCLKNID